MPTIFPLSKKKIYPAGDNKKDVEKSEKQYDRRDHLKRRKRY